MRDITFILQSAVRLQADCLVPWIGSTELLVLNLALTLKYPHRVLPPWPRLRGKGLGFKGMRPWRQGGRGSSWSALGFMFPSPTQE